MIDRAIIVAGGQSAKGFEPPKGVTVIAVNGAIDWLRRADYWFSLDPSPENVYRSHIQRIGVQYVMALPDDFETSADIIRLKRITKQGKEPEKHTPEWWLWRWGCVKGLSENRNQIHAGNSAYGALGWAYQLGARKVLLVGVDADDRERIEGGKTNNLSHLPLLFESAMNQVEMVNSGKMQSAIPNMTIDEGLAWLIK